MFMELIQVKIIVVHLTLILLDKAHIELYNLTIEVRDSGVNQKRDVPNYSHRRTGVVREKEAHVNLTPTGSGPYDLISSLDCTDVEFFSGSNTRITL
ncbi:protocadherin Fat 4 [Biomphalaria pfeifferi]|uniref:Protocadherin Fat 4 n=1 Tax=Biomphalaria pfeifferi TaxID=112525 RepID=A0AAD8B8C5_BIOPF|nr:protocadherin Fat 4 [Biomphalaria pfeifferi]